MSKYTSISEARELSAGDPIPRMKVIVKEAYPAKEGDGPYGPWRITKAKLSDSTGEISAAFFNSQKDGRWLHGNISNLKGNEIEIVSGQNGKGQFSGITTLDYTNNQGVKERQLKVSQDCQYDEAGIESGVSEAPKDQSSPPRQVYQADSDQVRRASFERQKALECAVSFLSSKDVVTSFVIETAESFYQFIAGIETPVKEETKQEHEDARTDKDETF
jgi:hypothetical protein